MNITHRLSKYLYIPIKDNMTLLVKKGDYVLKGMKLARVKGERTYIFSPISGQIIELEEKYTWDQQKIKCIKIQNDYEERLEKDQEPISCFHEKIDNKIDFKTFVLKIGMKRSFAISDYMIIKDQSASILETIDWMMKKENIKKSYIVLPKYDQKIKKQFQRYLGTYPNIILIENPFYNHRNWDNKIQKYIKKRNSIFHHTIIIRNLDYILNMQQIRRGYSSSFMRYVVVKVERKMEVFLVKLGTPIIELLPHDLNNKKIYSFNDHQRYKIDFINDTIIDEISDKIGLEIK